MTHKEFLVLSTIATAPAPLTQRAVAAQTGMSVGSVNEAVSNLTEQGLVADRHITDEGLDALEPYRVKRAVLIAAGFGSRMVPITLNTPKPLVRVGRQAHHRHHSRRGLRGRHHRGLCGEGLSWRAVRPAPLQTTPPSSSSITPSTTRQTTSRAWLLLRTTSRAPTSLSPICC